MKPDLSYMPVPVIWGEGAVEKSASNLSAYGKKCLIVTGKTSAKSSGALDDVINALKQADISYNIFNEITENPRTVDCCRGGELARDIKADFVIGIGGGSPLDASKAVCIYASNPQIIDDDIYTAPVQNKPLPLVLIGTTAGTGSEVTAVSVLTRVNGRKQSVSGENYLARLVLADPEYTNSVPYKTTVSTALDALCHAVESMFTIRATAQSQELSLECAKKLYPILKAMVGGELPTPQLREILYLASLEAGYTIYIGGTAFPHGMGYALTEDYNVPHGLACAVFLPRYLKEAEKINPELAEKLYMAMGTDYSELEKMFQSLCSLDLKIPQEKINEYELRWESLKNFKSTSMSFNHKDGAQLVRELFK